MNRTPFKYLLYREYIMSKQMMFPILITQAVLFVTSVLVQLSILHGNLRYITAEGFLDFTSIVMVVFPVAYSGMLLDLVTRKSIKDVEGKWSSYRLSLPISAVRLAAAKYTLMLMVIAAGIAVSAVFLTIMSLIGSPAVTEDNIKLAAVLFMMFVISGVLMQCAFMYFRSTDKGGLFAMGVLVVLLMIFVAPNVMNNKGQQVEFTEVMAKAAELFPLIAALTIAVLIAGFFFTVFIYKRREK